MAFVLAGFRSSEPTPLQPTDNLLNCIACNKKGTNMGDVRMSVAIRLFCCHVLIQYRIRQVVAKRTSFPATDERMPSEISQIIHSQLECVAKPSLMAARPLN